MYIYHQLISILRGIYIPLKISVTVKLNVFAQQTRERGSYHSVSESTVVTMQRADKKLTLIPVVFILLRMWGTIQFITISAVDHLIYFGCVPYSYAVVFKVLAYMQVQQCEYACMHRHT